MPGGQLIIGIAGAALMAISLYQIYDAIRGGHARESKTEQMNAPEHSLFMVLGRVGRNFGAGMTGGRAYVHDAEGLLGMRVNPELVESAALSATDSEEVRELVARHLRYTGSEVAQRLLDDWGTALGQLRLIVPRADAARVESEHEGTAAVEAAQPAAVEAGK